MPKDDYLTISAKILYNKYYVIEKYGNINSSDLKNLVWKDIKRINANLPNYKHVKNLILTDEHLIKNTTHKVKRIEEIKKIK